MSDDAPDPAYLRYVQQRLLQGLSAALPYEPETEPSNVHSIEAARTRRATAQIMRGRAPPERRL